MRFKILPNTCNAFSKKQCLVLLCSLSLLFLTFTTVASAAEPIQLLSAETGDDALPKGWEPLTFRKVERHTKYQLVDEDGRPVIKAESDASASGIKKPLDLDPKIYQTISWCWKVENIISKGDVSKKSGDDYAARIYVTFRFNPDKASLWESAKFNTFKAIYGEFPPRGALNYVWANRLAKGESADNAFTARAQMFAVQSGKAEVGKWLCEERNLYEDYKKLFGEEPNNISGIAVMTDTDNTGETASASYADLVLK